MRENPKPQEIYRHFKGNFYQIITLAKHSESGEVLVVYQALYGNCQVYARPLAEFMSEVDKDKYPAAANTYRFEKAARISMEEETEAEQPLLFKEQPQAEKETQTQAEKEAQPQTEKENEGREALPQNKEEEELNIDPLVMEFLDADSYEQKLNILAALHPRITNEMIDTMAAVSDIEINAGDVEERYEALKSCMLTLEKYECNRLR